jgi:C4-dicarboxylate-specific signal transduction histidine kinase
MREKDFSIGEYIVGPASRRAVLPFAYPIIAADGRLQGIVAVSLDLEKYGRSFSYHKFPQRLHDQHPG